MKKLIFNNWGLKIASLFLAAIMWFLVVQIEDPKDTRTFNNIQIKITGKELLEKENKIYEVLDNSDMVTVTVRAPKSIISQLRASDIVAEADVSKLTDINTIAITYSIQNVDVEYTINGNHDVVKLNIEDKSSKWVKVTYDTVGKVADGYIISGITPDQTHIEVSGPKSSIDNISYAHVEIDVSDATSKLTGNPDITLYDKDGNKIGQKNITKNVEYVHMTVEVLATKRVPVVAGFIGVPETGYIATGKVECEPQYIVIAGSSVALSMVNQITIPEDRLNITGENQDMSDIINIKEFLPDTIKLADSEFNGKITAKVLIEKLVDETITIPIKNIGIVNIPEGYTVKASYDGDGHIETEIQGLLSDVSTVAGGDVKGTIDIKKWMENEDIEALSEGSFRAPVVLELDERIKLLDDVRLEIEVTKEDREE